jgi:hypothetical protein
MSEETEKIGENTEYNDPETGKFIAGNPGKPKGTKHKPKFIDELDAMLDEMAEGKDYTYRQALKKKVLAKMIIDGDTRLLTEYWQQKDGKPLQRNETDLTTGGQPFDLYDYAKRKQDRSHDSNLQNNGDDEESESNPGGDIGEQDV